MVTLASSSSGGTFSSTSPLTIAAGASGVSFTYRDTLVGTPTITATSAGLGAVAQQETVYSSTTTVVKPDPAGLGSYASTPPGGQNAPEVYGVSYDWIDRPANTPLPTNDWWTLILKPGFAGSLYSLPQKLFTAGNGVTVSGFTGINSVANNIGYSGEQTITLGGTDTSFTRDALVNYGDWSLKFRMERATNQYVDVTDMQGSPIAWYEYTNISPTIGIGSAGSYGNIVDANGASLGNGSAGFTTDHFRFTKAGVTFGVFAPPGTVFRPDRQRPERRVQRVGTLPRRRDAAGCDERDLRQLLSTRVRDPAQHDVRLQLFRDRRRGDDDVEHHRRGAQSRRVDRSASRLAADQTTATSSPALH